jgi:hypothetical protein
VMRSISLESFSSIARSVQVDFMMCFKSSVGMLGYMFSMSNETNWMPC